MAKRKSITPCNGNRLQFCDFTEIICGGSGQDSFPVWCGLDRNAQKNKKKKFFDLGQGAIHYDHVKMGLRMK